MVAAHRGDLGAVKSYLAALERYAPKLGDRLEVQRLEANLAVVDGDEEVALATFRELTEISRAARGLLEAARDDLASHLRDDPSLGGLLDPRDGEALARVEGALARSRAVLESSERQAEVLQKALDGGGPYGPTRRALEILDGADALLRRAAHLLGVRYEGGWALVAGPAEAALAQVREARALRRALDEARRRVARQHVAEQARLLRQLEGVEDKLVASREALDALERYAAADLVELRAHLYARAEAAVERLEMSEDIGILEIAWRRKVETSREVGRLRREYDAAKATLVSDVGEGRAVLEE